MAIDHKNNSLYKCVYDGTRLIKVTGREIHPENPEKEDRIYYQCPKLNCGAYVRAHDAGDNEGLPRGFVANEELRSLKVKAYQEFGHLWMNKATTKRELYREAAEDLGIPMMYCHIAKFCKARLLAFLEWILYKRHEENQLQEEMEQRQYNEQMQWELNNPTREMLMDGGMWDFDNDRPR